MGVLNFLTGTAGYTAILAAFGLAVAAHFVMHCAAWWLALCSYLMPPQEPTQ